VTVSATVDHSAPSTRGQSLIGELRGSASVSGVYWRARFGAAPAHPARDATAYCRIGFQPPVSCLLSTRERIRLTDCVDETPWRLTRWLPGNRLEAYSTHSTRCRSLRAGHCSSACRAMSQDQPDAAIDGSDDCRMISLAASLFRKTTFSLSNNETASRPFSVIG
jgi:hypothetical protein